MAKKSCQICMAPEIKDEISRILQEEGSRPEISVMGSKGPVSLEEIPDCSDGSMVGCEGGGGKRSGGTRAPSKYNIFVKECMSRSEIKNMPQKERMGACAAEWKRSK